MKKVAGRLRLALAQFRELQAFMQFASDVDETTRKRIRQGQIITEILKQDDLAPVPFERQTAVLYAGLNNYFDHLAVEQIKETERRFVEYIERFHEEDILKPIQETGDLTSEDETKLKEAIGRFLESIQG